MGSALIISVVIRAIDGASSVLSMLGLNGIKSMGLLQAAAATTAVAILGIGAYSLKAATTFDYNMAKIAALTTTSAAQMQWYKDQILAMAPQLDQAPTALAQGLYFVISAGYQGADALNILKLSAQAAAATMTPMKDVADLLTTAMNAYRGSNLSAGHAMDDIIKLVVNGKVTMSSLATSFGFVGVTARAAGLSFDEASAAVSTLSQIAGEHGSRRVMMGLDNLLRSTGIDVDAVAKRAKSLGIAFDEGKFAAMPFIDKLQYLAQITGGVGYNLDMARIKTDLATGNMQDMALATAQANSKFKTLIGGAAAFIPAFMLLSDKGGMYNTILKQMGGNGQATADAFAKMRESTGQKWNMFKVTLETIATVIGLHLLPVVNRLMDFLIKAGHGLITFLQSAFGMKDLKTTLLGIGAILTAILGPAILGVVASAAPFVAMIAAIILGGKLLGPKIEELVKHFGGWKQIGKDLGDALGLVRDAVGWVADKVKDFIGFLQSHEWAMDALKAVLITIAGFIVGTLIEAVVGATIAFAGMAVAVIAATWPFLLIGAVIAAIVFGVIELVKHFGKVKQFFGQVAGEVGRFFGSIFGSIGDALGAAGGAIGHLVAPIVKLFGAVFAHVGKEIGKFGAPIAKAVESIFHSIVLIVKKEIQLAVAIARITFEAFKAVFAVVAGIVTKIILPPLEALGGVFLWLWQNAVQPFLNFLIGKVIPFLVGVFLNNLKLVANVLKTIFQSAWAVIVGVFDAIVQVISGAIQVVVGIIQAVVGVIAGVIATISDVFTGGFGKLGGDLTGIWNSIVGGFKTIWGGISGIAQGIWNGITSVIKGGINLIIGLIDDFINSINSIKIHVPKVDFPGGSIGGGDISFPHIPDIPKLAEGGIATRSTLANIGEGREPEAVLPLSYLRGMLAQGMSGALGGRAGMGAGQPHSVIINANFPNVRDKDQIKQALLELQQEQYRRGRRAGGYGGLRAGVAPI